MRKKYREHMPDLCSMLDYIDSLKFKGLFGENTAIMYNMYMDRYCPVGGLMYSVIESVAVARYCSTEKQTFAALLYSTYSRKEIEEAVRQLQDILKQKGGSVPNARNTDDASNHDSCTPFSSESINGEMNVTRTGMRGNVSSPGTGKSVTTTTVEETESIRADATSIRGQGNGDLERSMAVI